MHPDVARLFRKIDAVRGQENRVACIRGLTAVLGSSIGLLVLFLLLDWGFHLPVWGRVLLWLIMLGVMGRVLFKYVIVPMRSRPTDDAIALRVESRHPELGGRLISVVQLARADQAALYADSVELIHALEEDASRRALPIAFEEIINWGALRKLTFAAGASLVVAILFTLFGGEVRDTFFHRLVGMNTRYPTHTRIDRDAVKARGDLADDPSWTLRGGRYTVEVSATGELPPDGVLLVTRPDGSEESFKMVLLERD